MIKLYYKTTGEEPDVDCIEPCKYDCRPSEGTMNRKTLKSKYPSYCCQDCGECIGWLGRFVEWIYCGLVKHKCKSK